MAITNITPAANQTIQPASDVAFTIDDTYTSVVIKYQSSTALESVYNSGAGGAQSGYTVAVVDNGGTHTFTFSRDAGWDLDPAQISVTEDETGSEATTTWTYDLFPTTEYSEGMNPYNSQGQRVLIVQSEDVLVAGNVGILNFDDTFTVAVAGSGKVTVTAVGGSGGSGNNSGLGSWTKGNDTIGFTAANSFDVNNVTLLGVTQIRILASNPLGGAPINNFVGGLAQTGTLLLQDISDPSANAVTFNVDSHVVTSVVYWDLFGTMEEDHGTNWATSYSVQWVPDNGVTPNAVTSAGVFVDNRLIKSDGSLRGVQDSGITVDDSDNVTNVGSLTATSLRSGYGLHMDEQSGGPSVSAGEGAFYTKDDAPSRPKFKSDDGNEWFIDLGGPVGATNNALVKFDGTSGKLTKEGQASTSNIENEAVTLAKMAHMATASFLARTSGGTGDVQVIAATPATAMLDEVTTTNKGLVPAPGIATPLKYFNADGTYTVPVGTVVDIAPGLGKWEYDSTTTDSDPGTGKLRYSNASLVTNGSWYIDDISGGGLNMDNAGDAGVFAHAIRKNDFLRVTEVSDDTTTYLYRINADPSDSTGYWEIPCTYIDKGTNGVALTTGSDVSVVVIPKASFTLAELSERVEDQDVVGDLDTRLGSNTIGAAIFEWKTGGGPTTDPTAGFMQTGSATRTGVTDIQFDDIPSHGSQDIGAIMGLIGAGSILVFTNVDDPKANNVSFVADDPATDKTGFWTVPVTFDEQDADNTTFTTGDWALTILGGAGGGSGGDILTFTLSTSRLINATNWCQPLQAFVLAPDPTGTYGNSVFFGESAGSNPDPWNYVWSNTAQTTAAGAIALTGSSTGGYEMPAAGELLEFRIVEALAASGTNTLSYRPFKVASSGTLLHDTDETLSLTTSYIDDAWITASAGAFSAGDRIGLLLKFPSAAIDISFRCQLRVKFT